MVSTRSQTKKTCFWEAFMEAPDQQSTPAFIASNDDLLTEILIRLPVKSIFRFKSVSKHWRWLLTHTHFTRLHDNHNKSPGVFVRNIYVPFDVEDRSTPCLRDLDLYFNHRGIKVVQSCNGLLLCCSNWWRIVDSEYYVLNPTTKQLALIPPVPGGPKVRRTIRLMALAFHQTDCVHYKVVCIRSLETDEDSFQIQIYSSETRKWKICNESFSARILIFFKPVYWNGAVHWAPYCSNYFYFKLDVEQLQTLPLPEGLVSSKISTMYFGESRGHLHLIVHTKCGLSSPRFNVYEMLTDYSGWFVKYQIHFDEFPRAFPRAVSPCGYRFEVTDVVRGEKEEDTFLVLLIPGRMITFSIHDNSFKEIYSRVSDFFEEISSVHRYTKTLTSV